MYCRRKLYWYLIVGLGFPLAAHVSVTLSPISAVTFLGGVTITGADHSGWIGSGSTIDVRTAKSKLQRVNKEFSKYLIKTRTCSQGFEAFAHWSARQKTKQNKTKTKIHSWEKMGTVYPQPALDYYSSNSTKCSWIINYIIVHYLYPKSKNNEI